MDPLRDALVPGRHVTLHLAGGQRISGLLTAIQSDWVTVMASEGETLVALRGIIAAALPVAPPAGPDGPSDDRDQPLPRPRSKDVPMQATQRTPGRAWTAPDMAAIAHAFLDGHNDTDIARQHGRTRHQITTLRQAHEVLRGNLAEDLISPVARSWVARLRRALGGTH
jgi:hypothetical protein